MLIAGLACDTRSWTPVIDGFSKRFQTIVFDNRGVGRSGMPESPYGIRDMAEDTLKLLDHLNLQSTNIIGHSLGGYIAQEFAIRYPGRVNKLILESTAPQSSARNNLLFQRFLEWRLNGMELEPWIWAWSFWLFPPPRFEDRSFIDAHVKAALQNPHPQSTSAFKGQIEAILTHNTLARLKKIRAETLVIEGEEDILIPPEEAGQLAKRIPGCSMSVVEDAGHIVHVEKPEAFIRTALDFLS